MSTELAAFSKELAAIVEKTAPSVAAVHARPRFPSSGVFWRRGVIVTAEHTIRREDEITVTLPDGKTAPATLAGSDPGTDIAVLKAESDAPVLPHAAGPTVPGQIALSIGRSPDSGANATMGIISAVSGEWRTWRGGRLDQYMRLDLTLYPGTSGGAIVNTAGEVIGIASSALSRIAGVAIPSATIDRVVEQILARGRVSRGYLGVGLQPVELPDHQKALIVLSIAPEGPAASAGVLMGDILVSLGGASVADTDDIQTVLESHAPGQTVEAAILRGGVPQSIRIMVGERPRRE